MASETVFYFDVLGFRGKAGGDAEAAVDALTDLASLLGTPAIAHLTGPWASQYGAHYRELLLLLARSVERIARFQKQGAPATPPMVPFLKREEVIAACESISGLPEEYVTAVMRLVEP